MTESCEQSGDCAKNVSSAKKETTALTTKLGKSAATSDDSGEAAEKTAKNEASTEAPTKTKEVTAGKPAPKKEEKEATEEKPAPAPKTKEVTAGKPAPKKEEKPAPEEKPAEKPAAGPIVGDYIIKGYDGNKNDWHYVKISPVEGKEGVYRWSNRAGVKWTLTKKSDTKFEVGKDCPYHKTGHTEATLKLNEDGKAVSISGPWNEVYIK